MLYQWQWYLYKFWVYCWVLQNYCLRCASAGFCLQVHLYEKIAAANITYVSVGHRSSLYDYHNRILRISTYDSNDEQLSWCIGATRPDSYLKFTNLWLHRASEFLAMCYLPSSEETHGSISLINNFDVYDANL